MKEVTKQLIKDFKIRELGYDFMGYPITKDGILSFHHTIISHSKCLREGLGDGYWRWNGSILIQDTSHNYLHTIERIDDDRFYDITCELIDMNNKGYLDIDNLRYIHDILTGFEREHCADISKTGKPLIKEKYLKRVRI